MSSQENNKKADDINKILDTLIEEQSKYFVKYVPKDLGQVAMRNDSVVYLDSQVAKLRNSDSIEENA